MVVPATGDSLCFQQANNNNNSFNSKSSSLNHQKSVTFSTEKSDIYEEILKKRDNLLDDNNNQLAGDGEKDTQGVVDGVPIMNASDLRVHVPLANVDDLDDSLESERTSSKSSSGNSLNRNDDDGNNNGNLSTRQPRSGKSHDQPSIRSKSHSGSQQQLDNAPSLDANRNSACLEDQLLNVGDEDYGISNNNLTPRLKSIKSRAKSPGARSTGSEMETTFEDMGGSLEDLVTTFDERITTCFKNYDEQTEVIAPVQMRSQEEIMNESQIWWTLTGNFGNMLPLDWSKTTIREKQQYALNIHPKSARSDVTVSRDSATGLGSDEEDDELAAALDMHSLVGQSPHSDATQTQTAEQVIEEIDLIMEGSAFTTASSSDQTMESVDSLYSSLKSPYPMLDGMTPSMSRDATAELEAKLREATSLTSSADNLAQLPYAKLLNLQGELESLIQAYNEALVQELALKDELEYEKELKNTFISLLLSVQNKRRQFITDHKRKSAQNSANGNASATTASSASKEKLPQYCTAVIPYAEHAGPPNNATVQALIRILKAVNEDNPNVPTMLTDYILNVVCPSAEGSL